MNSDQKNRQKTCKNTKTIIRRRRGDYRGIFAELELLTCSLASGSLAASAIKLALICKPKIFQLAQRNLHKSIRIYCFETWDAWFASGTKK